MAQASDEDRFLSLAPEDGTGIGNKRLREQLGWDEEKYERVRERLIDKGAIARGPGQGGSVKRVLEEDDSEAPAEESASEPGGARRGRRPDEERLISFLPEEGTGIGNKGLREQLGWDEEKYERVRERLIEKGAIARGPGQGGSVKRVLEADDSETPAEESASEPGGARRGRRADEERLVSLLPEEGTGIGNKGLREQLGWDEEKYERVRERLIEKGTIARGPGQGGSVKRVLEEDDSETPAEESTNESGGARRGRRPDEERLLALIPEDGSRIGNKSLREQLGWEDEKYARVRARLIEKGIVARDSGSGGSLKRIEGEERAFLSVTPFDGTDISSKQIMTELGWSEDNFQRVRDRLLDKGLIIVPPGRGKGHSVQRVSSEESSPRLEKRDDKPDAVVERTKRDVPEILKPEPEPPPRRGHSAVRPKVFIGSSVEGLDIAERIQRGLDYFGECTIWSQGVFGLSGGNLENLVAATKRFDFAVLVLTPDDMVTKRNVHKNSPRDNVLFELGLFMGALGREKTFIVHCRDKDIDLPTDLAGVTLATFRDRSDGNLQAALGPVCLDIKEAIRAVADGR